MRSNLRLHFQSVRSIWKQTNARHKASKLIHKSTNIFIKIQCSIELKNEFKFKTIPHRYHYAIFTFWLEVTPVRVQPLQRNKLFLFSQWYAYEICRCSRGTYISRGVGKQFQLLKSLVFKGSFSNRSRNTPVNFTVISVKVHGQGKSSYLEKKKKASQFH